MSCRHGWHECGPWYGPHCDRGPYGPPQWHGPVDWYGPADWYGDEDRPIRRRYRAAGRPEREATPATLEARLAELREEIRRIEIDLRRPDTEEEEPT